MTTRPRIARSLLSAAMLTLTLAACAPAPLYKTGPTASSATPTQVAAAPGNYNEAQIVWGGRIIHVENLQATTRVEILAYPLDSSQRPRLNAAAAGRFIAEVPGFLDPMNYPEGTPVTVIGQVAGTQDGRVGEAAYVFPLVQVASAGNLHRWTAEEMRQGRSNFSFGFGVGIGTRIH